MTEDYMKEYYERIVKEIGKRRGGSCGLYEDAIKRRMKGVKKEDEEMGVIKRNAGKAKINKESERIIGLKVKERLMRILPTTKEKIEERDVERVMIEMKVYDDDDDRLLMNGNRKLYYDLKDIIKEVIKRNKQSKVIKRQEDFSKELWRVISNDNKIEVTYDKFIKVIVILFSSYSYEDMRIVCKRLEKEILVSYDKEAIERLVQAFMKLKAKSMNYNKSDNSNEHKDNNQRKITNKENASKEMSFLKRLSVTIEKRNIKQAMNHQMKSTQDLNEINLYCTFKPNILLNKTIKIITNKSTLYNSTQEKYLHRSQLKQSQDKLSLEKSLQECTFKPNFRKISFNPIINS